MQRVSRQRTLVAIFLCLQQVFLFNSPLIGMASAPATGHPALPRAWLPFARPSLPPARPSAIAPVIAPRPSLPVRVPTTAFAPAPAPPPAPGPSDCSAPANAIVAENCLPGNTGWEVPGAGDNDILGFATDISVNRGDSIAFKINTPATDYRIDIYRMGYYGGAGARKVATIQPSVALPQAQPACLTDSTGLVDCGNWFESASWLVPPTATSGIYFARPVREDQGAQPQPSASHIPFIVRNDDGHSDLLFQTSDTTWQAYNDYGGASLYAGSLPAGRAYKVSYNRPFITRNLHAESYVFNAEYPMVRWLERNGYDVSYFTDLDSERHGSEILEHKAFLSVGHDEYWSGPQRTNVEAARNAGVHLAFFSGNESFWKTRWEPSIDGTGTLNRTLVSYKETHANAKIDPSPLWTGTWRDPRFSPPADGGRPENALTGTLFQVNGPESKSIVVTQPEGRMRFWLNTSAAALEGTNNTLTLPAGTLGYEWDGAPDDASRPPGLLTLSTATYSVAQKLQDYGTLYTPGTVTHHLTMYRHGASIVFGAGTIQWAWGLDAVHDRAGTPASAAMQQATVNLLADMGVQPTTIDAGLVPATASSDTTPPSSTIDSPAGGATLAVGSPITISGSAGDTGGIVGGVEVSVDGGATWHAAEGHESWTYDWTPVTQGPAVIKSRALDDSGNIETPGAGASVIIGPPHPYVCPCTIWPDTTIPNVTSNTDFNSVELGVRFRSQVNGFITGVRFYKGALNTGSHTGHLWTNNGVKLAEATFTTETGSGWQQVTFATPVAITANTVYVASYHTTSGAYAIDRPYFDTSVHLAPPLEAVQDSPTSPNGVFIYAAAPGAFPNGSFQSTNYWVDVVFDTLNTPPTAVNDSYAVDEDTTLTVPASGVLANDTDPDPGTMLTALLVSPAANGTVTLAADGSFSYTPQANFTGSDSFAYRVSDGDASSNTATVTITVNPVNDLPNAVDDSYLVAEDGTLTVGAPGVLLNDTDVDNMSLSAALGAPPSHGALTLNANGSFSYTPSPNFNGTDTFTYRANDGLVFSNTATVAIIVTSVNDPPTSNAGADQTITLPAAASLTGVATDDGAFTAVWSKVSGPGTVVFGNPNAPVTTATFSAPGSYELALTANDGEFVVSDSVTITVNAPTPTSSGIKFDGVNDFVTFGAAAGTTKLGATTFTLETWFRKDGPGLTASTGTGGLTAAIPLVTKGVAQADGSNLDANYFLGIDSKTRTLAADFEDTATGANHPVFGTTLIADGLWYHAAATYDGTTWRLYLNGVLETQLVVGTFTPRSDSVQHAGLGTALNSVGLASGAFQGALDEARIWNVARSAAQIQTAMGGPITTPAANLIGRWALDEGTGTTTADTSGRADNGTLTNGPVWVPGSPFAFSPWPAGNYGVKMAGTVAIGDYATFGPAPSLGAATFTIETWFRRDGAGVSTSTGTGGVDAIPLITKGRAEGEATNVDMNYFLGIRATDGVLVADFEEGATGTSPGLNHPVIGITPIAIAPVNPTAADWHHAAATYDGTTLRLYLDGVLQSSVAVGQPPRADSIQHAGLGTAFNSTGVAAGFFAGVIDEARVWNYARSGAQIANGKTRPITSATGLLGRWGFDDGFGIVHDSSGNNQNGTMSQSTGWTWVPGAPFTGTSNTPPVVNAGPDAAVTLPATAALSGSASDDGVVSPLVTTWTKTSGPGTVTFGNASLLSTTATFSLSGTYVLTLTASDGELVSSDTISVVVSGVVNQTPVVNAGPDQTLTVPNATASLLGTATDDGLPGPLTTQWTKVSGPGTVTFGDAALLATTATFSLQGAYVLRLTANDGALSANDTIAITVDSSPANKGIAFGGTNAYVTLGPAPGLGATKFTIETWFRRDGAGVATFTGTGGVTAIPLVTKGMAEVDETSNKDMNYFLGIRQTDGVLVADFEDTLNGGNHPIAGVTPIPADGVWRHAAATYDGTTWRLYLNGVADATLAVGAFTPRADSIQHAALGGALNSTGGVGTQPQGFFSGALDEARIWNYARTQPQIAAGRAHEIVTAPGLLGRWGFNEITGTVVADSSGHGINGTLVGTNFTRVFGAPFSIQGNTAPIAVADTATTLDNAAATVSVLANDTDADGDVLAVVSVTAPAHGTAAINANGTITYTPAGSYNGADSFSYTISDGQGGTATATVSITVTASNHAPVAVNDAYTTNEDTPLTIATPGVLGNDTDADSNPLTAIQVSGPANGALTLNANGSFTYTPNANFNGSDGFTYKANDGTLDSNTATVSITVTAVNDAPVAVNDTYGTTEDTTLMIAEPGVLGNDTDADGDMLSATPVTDPANGSVTVNADGSFIYTPNANFNGTDSFTYLANDGTADSNIATVTITVSAVNDAPSAANDSYTTAEDTPLTIAAPGVLANDTDADGNPLTAIVVSQPANGTLTPNADGSFTYTPNLNFNGSDGYTYKANDGTADSNVATVTIAVTAVNDAPVAANDSYATAEDTPVTIPAPGVLGNDTDVDANSLTAIVVSQPASGTVTLNADGSFTYTPALNFNGSDSFTYKANDGTADSNIATVTIGVSATNDAPVAGNDSYATAEDAPLTIAAPGVIGNDTDADGNALTAIVVSQPANGSLTLNADGSFTYTPALNFNGSDSFTYKANDGTADSNVATVTITVNAVNDAPVAGNDSYATAEDTTLTIVAPGVLGNDTDADGNALTAIVVSQPANGALTLNADGSFTYAPALNFNGSDSFTYKANDGTADSNVATVTIAVNAVNDAPVAGNDSYATAEDTTLTIVAPGVLGNDTDADGNALTAIVVSQPANGALTPNTDGSFTYAPNLNFNGSDSFTYKANDGTADSNVATVTIAVNAVNDAPVAGNDSYATAEDTTLTIVAPGVLGNDTDADGNALTAIVVSQPANGALTPNTDGSFTYAPNPNFNGSDSFTYKANDGTADSNVATVTIAVNAVNDAPVSINDSYSTTEDTPLTIAAPGVLANDTDVDGNPLTAVVASQPANGAVTLNANGSFTYTPNLNFNGSDSFTYEANDGTADSNIATVTITVSAVNDAPLAVNDSYTTAEDTPLTIAAPGVLTNDTDVDGNPLTAIVVSQPANGTVTVNANGSFTYTPNLNFNGSNSFTYKANDGTADSNIATVTIAVTATNDAPVAVNDSYTTAEDTPLTIAAPGVLGNDTDVDGNPLTAIVVSQPANGTLTLNASGSFIYTPALNFNGSDSFTYKANDGTADSNVATVTIGITATNDAPVAVNDSYTTAEDTLLTIAAPGVLGNDTDVDGNPLTAIVVSQPANGTLTLNASGSFTYTPALNFNGSDSFTYRANDGTADSNVATVTITVNAVNDAPVAVNDTYTATEDTPLTIAAPGVLANDTDADGNTLMAAVVAQPAHGAVTVNADGGFTYTPALNYNGSDSFTYKANDGTADSNVATVNLTVSAVNDAPVAVNDNYTATEDTPLTIAAPGILGNDTDADGNPLTAAIVSQPAHGTATVNADGSFTYTPALNYNGSDSFTYKANDGTADSNVSTVNLTVSAVNDAPVAINDNYNATEDTALTIAAPGVLANDTDVDGNPLTAIVVSQPVNGTLTLNAAGSFVYTPNADFNGSDSFSYKANDGTADSNIVIVTINVGATNDAPVAVNDSYTTAEDTPLTIAAPGVLGNDTDADGNTLTALLVSGPANGALTLNAGGSFTYTPNANFNGSDSFTYKANDGTADSNIATVTITVSAVNDAPVAVNDSYNATEDTPLTIAAPGVIANDTDADGTALTAAVVAQPAHGTVTVNANGSFTYTPASNYNGSDSFTYKANDGTADSNVATVTITIGATNDAPVAVNDSYNATEDTPLTIAAPGVVGNDTDVDGNPLTAAVVAQPAHGSVTVNANGSFTYTPASNYNGGDSFTYKANDGTADSNVATVTITIGATNDAPVAVNDSYNATEDTPLTIAAPGVLGNDTDVDGNPLTAAVVAQPAHGTVTVNADGSFTYTPAANYNGGDSFTYKANDGTADSNVATVTITIGATNDAPVAVNDSYNATEDTPLTIAAPGVLANDTDVDGNSLTAAVVAQPAHGTVTVNADGSFTYTPAANYNGADAFTYKANDGTADSNVATVTITIGATNDAPVAVNDSYNATEDTPLTIAAPGVLTNDTDVDGNPLTAAVVAQPAHGTVTVNADGSFTYTPAANYNGADAFTYKANDGTADSNVATVSITVAATNDAPVAVNDSYNATEDTPLTIAAPGVLTNDTDVDGNPLTAAVVSQPAHGTATVNADGSITYTPASNYNGADAFIYKANDGTADSNVATVSITVAATNDAPVAVNDSYNATEDTPLTIAAPGVLANDTDVDGNPLTAAVVSQPAHGTATVNADGSITYTPASNYNGADAFTYKANDGTADSNVATVSITVAATNDAPVAVNDSYNATEDTPLTIAAPGVLANDTDVEGNPLTAVVVAQPAHGTVTVNANGSFTYTPASNYYGADAFTYKANDGTADSNVATVNLTVAAVNDAPVVGAGPDLNVTLPASASLNGTVVDVDGPPPTITWSQISGPGTTTFGNANAAVTTASFSTAGTYVLRLTASDGTSTVFDEATMTVSSTAEMALRFDGVNDYVTFGQVSGPTGLGVTTFTLETWFKREGPGIATSTGTGGLVAVPLITKGMAQADGSNLDMNYFLGLDPMKRVLVADFEDMATGGNHPVAGVTPISNGIWYHAAVTYDGTTWRLYLNGVLETQLVVGSFTPRSDSIQHAALGTALGSGGTVPSGQTAGAFAGSMDEVRIWSVARTAAEIQGAMGSALGGPAPNLLGRWSLNESTGTTAADTSGRGMNGTWVNGPVAVTGSGYTYTPLAPGNYGLHMTGTAAASDYVTFGAAPGLNAATFTIETWFKRDGTGVSTSTGTGGVDAIPLVTKGRAEAEGSNVDMNYFLGIRATDNVLVADFEDMATGLNHPVSGSTAIPADGTWRHAAVTYDGTTWRLYLNGALEAQLVVGGFTPRSDSIQHAGLGTAFTSTGVAAGFFAGTLDETRIWNVARSAAQILASKDQEISGAASGLLGRWGFNTTTGQVLDTSGNNRTGTLNGTSWAWVTPGAPVSAGTPNTPPVVNAGADAPVVLPASASLSGTATDDGLPGTGLTTTWSKTSGPGTVIFGNPAALSTTASFSVAGTYVLTLTGNDGALSASDDVTITVTGIVNLPPVVNAGVDQTISLPTNSVSLAGTATDDGLPGLGVTTQWTKVSGPGTVTFGNAAALSTTATFSTAGTYVLQLSASDSLLSATDTMSVTVNPNAADRALRLDGTNAYVTFGPAPGLAATTFTIETWFRRDGAGIATNTGTGGVVAVPLVTKGMAESENAAVDMNYFLGIRGSDNVLVADFEDTASSANHPVAGTTAIPADGVWRHAAATYDGTTWRLYLNGVLEAQLVVGATPQSAGTQHAALGTALNSTGGVGTQTQGFFNGGLDEARVWNYARSAQQVARGRQFEIANAPGLLGRWSLNASSGTSVADSTGHGITGTIIGTGFAWISPGAPFGGPANTAPVATNDTASTNKNTAATISVLANDTDADGDALSVSIATAPAHGTASVNANGTVLYTPTTNYEGSDSFTYSLSDNQGGTAAASVSLTIAGPANVPPVVNAGPDQTITLPTTVASLSGTATDDGVPGVGLTTQWSKVSGPGTVTFGNAAALSTTATFSATGSYVLQLSASDSVLSSTDTITVTLNANPANKGLDFGGTNAYVTFGPAPGLGVTTMTIETWFRRDGAGIATNTGSGGIVAVPLVTKGMAETESAAVDMNYFLGIRSTDNVLVADFEDTATSANHPIAGTTAIPADGTWRHAAATYDGTTWRLYLNGALEAQLVVGSFTPQSAGTQHAALGTALNSTGGVGSQTQGFFDGAMDEARVWNYARSAQQVSHGRQLEIVSAPGLRGRWGLNEGSGSVIGDSSGNGITGALVGTNVSWSSGAPFTGGNSAPVATNDSATTPESTVVTMTALANDSDADGDALTVASVGTPSHGAASVNANNTISYLPVTGYNGSDSFGYTISDGQGATATGTVNVTITSVNVAPVAAADSYNTDKNVALIVAADGVLDNDTDGDGDSLTAAVVGAPAHGDLTLNADGGFIYTPDAGYVGPDSFTYLADDGTLDSNVATATITVVQTNEAPVAVNDTGSTSEDTPLSVAAPGVLGNDTDADGNALTAVQVSGPAHGTLTLNANGSYVYTPAANYNGPDSFTYKANDGTANSNVATVSLSVSAVNDAPAAAADAFTTNEDGSLAVTTPGVLANDTDAEGNALTVSLVSGPSHGTVSLSGDGSFTYTPAANYSGPDSFTYKANDGAADSDAGTVTITVAPIPDAPSAANDSYATNEDTTLVLFGPAVLANDSDADGDALAAVLVTGPSHGTLSLNANGGFTYTPAVNYNGPDSFTYMANDGDLDSNAATVDITVNAVNDAPVAVSNSYSTSEDTALVVSPAGVLANDTDVDGSPLTAILVSGTAHGTLTLGVDGGFTYTPAANYNGPDSFTYKASDGVTDSNVVTVSLTVNSVNDAPVAVANSYTTNEDTPLSVTAPGLLANDSDVEGSALTAVKVTNPSHGTATVNANGSFSYTPTANYNGPDSFTYRANDGSLNSATVTVTLTVNAVNDAPVATPQSRSLNEDATRAIVLAGTDVDGSALTFAIVTPPVHGVLIGTAPNVTYDPDPNYNGPDSFTFRVNDGSLNSAPATVTLTVTPVNDAPVGQTASYTTPKNTPLNGTLVATDVDGDTLTYSINTQGGKGIVTVNPVTGAFTYTPNLNATGSDFFRFRANDGTVNSAQTRVDVTITP